MSGEKNIVKKLPKEFFFYRDLLFLAKSNPNKVALMKLVQNSPKILKKWKNSNFWKRIKEKLSSVSPIGHHRLTISTFHLPISHSLAGWAPPAPPPKSWRSPPHQQSDSAADSSRPIQPPSNTSSDPSSPPCLSSHTPHWNPNTGGNRTSPAASRTPPSSLLAPYTHRSVTLPPLRSRVKARK